MSSFEVTMGHNGLDQLSKLSSELLMAEDLQGSHSEDSSPSNSITPCVIPVGTETTKKSNKRKARAPKLDPDDVRHTYAASYFSALNSGDKATIVNTLNEIAIPGVVLMSKFTVPGTNTFMPNHVEIVGIDAIASTCASFIQAAPDVVMHVLSQEIEVYSNGESCITMKYSLQGTKVLELSGWEDGGEDKTVLKSLDNVNGALRELNSRLESLQLQSTVTSVAVDPNSGVPSEKSKTETFGVGGASKEVKNIAMEATNTFHLNINKKIFLIVSVK